MCSFPVYLKDVHPTLYDDLLLTMQNLRHEPAFVSPFYQVDPWYAQLKRQGLDANLPLHDQVQAVMLNAKFY